MRAYVVVAIAAWVAFAAPAAAQGEHERRLAAELTIVAGDLRHLEVADLPPLAREGLRARVAGALASLRLLLRQAGADPAPVAELRAALARRDWRALGARIEALRASHPFEARPWAFAEATPERMRTGAAIHAAACAGCHDASVADTRLPALDLFDQAKRMPREEFAARLLLGVRGDRSTAYRNPFSDLELAALVVYYAGARPGNTPSK